MGTISDKLMRIINTKEDIRRALISKGYDVPTSIPFKEYAKMILDLPCNADSFPDIEGIVARYSALGLTNEQMAENPVWKDLTGNGHDLQMKNFAWKGMSGVGGYTENYDSNRWYKVASRIDTTWTYKSFNVKSIKDNNLAQLFYQSLSSDTGFRVLSCTIKVSGLTDGQGIEYVSNGTRPTVIMRIENDGIYHLPSFDFEAKNAYYGFRFLKLQESCNITIEQLPLYPGFILGDGVDDFAVTEKELNFEDTYTVYTAFIPFQNNPTRNMILCGADSKKTFTMQYSSLVYVSFIAGNNYYINADFVNGLNLFACKRNGNNICIKNLLTNKVVTGTCGDWVENAGLYYLWKNATYASFAKAAIAGQTICNGYFSTDEDDEKVLDWYKKQYPWLFPDQAWTVTGKTNEDEDRATIANITGNGNNLVLSNFAFSGNSGYGSYPFGMNVWNPDYIADQPYGTVHYPNDSKSYTTTVKNNVTNFRIKFRLRGLPEGRSFLIRVFDMNDLNTVLKTYTYTKNGIHEFVYNDPNKPARIILYNGNTPSNVSEFYLDIIPEYEGYLVTDGVDDKVQSSSFTMNEDWTIVGDWELLSNVQINCGIVKAQNVYLYNTANGLLISINNPRSLQSFGTKSLHAICSDGRLYDRNWVEYEYTVDQNFEIVKSSLNIGFNLNNYTQIAFKNLGIYNNQILSKDDCIKAYNYLQTLKSK
jgi:hypothetical protein